MLKYYHRVRQTCELRVQIRLYFGMNEQFLLCRLDYHRHVEDEHRK